MTNGNIKIEDNFLAQEIFDKIQERLVATDTSDFPWYFRYKYYELDNAGKPFHKTDPIGDGNELDSCQFTHTFYESGSLCSCHLQNLNMLLDLLDPMSIWRITANLLTRVPTLVENGFHVDIAYLSEEKLKHWTTSIFYVNTNDGYTKFEDGTQVESVANRMLTFPANMRHTGTSCTDQQTRVVINFNYFK